MSNMQDDEMGPEEFDLLFAAGEDVELNVNLSTRARPRLQSAPEGLSITFASATHGALRLTSPHFKQASPHPSGSRSSTVRVDA